MSFYFKEEICQINVQSRKRNNVMGQFCSWTKDDSTRQELKSLS